MSRATMVPRFAHLAEKSRCDPPIVQDTFRTSCQQDAQKGCAMGARQVFALGGAAFGALAALNSALGSAPVPPVPSTSGEQEQFAWVDGIIRYTITGHGAPIVLL